LGAPHGLATAAQVAAAGIAIAAVWRAFRIGHPGRLAILLCAGLLASPHVSNYDLVPLAVAALMHVRTLPEATRPLVLMLPLAAWLAPLYNPPRAMMLGLVTPLLFLGLIWALFGGFPGQKPPPTSLIKGG
jgi:hypothetical protein